ncbi:MAG: hypothetical protein R3C55_03585 [Parvularculaceae bacterium]
MDALLLLVSPEQASGYEGKGDFDMGDDARIAFRSGEAPLTFIRACKFSRRASSKARRKAFSTRLLWDKALAEEQALWAVHDGFWMHVGDPEGLKLAEARSPRARAHEREARQP